jgi:hypothetical protein
MTNTDTVKFTNPTDDEEPVILTGNKPEDGASQTARGSVHSMPWGAAQGKYEPRDAKPIMLDEWLNSDTREQAIQAAKLLTPLPCKKR